MKEREEMKGKRTKEERRVKGRDGDKKRGRRGEGKESRGGCLGKMTKAEGRKRKKE